MTTSQRSRRAAASSKWTSSRRRGVQYRTRPTLEILEDRRLLAVQLASVTPSLMAPEAGNDYSTNPVINANGRFVAFQSHASDLVATDTNDTQDVFVRDLLLGTTALISINADGTDSAACDEVSPCSKSVTSGSFNPAISDDGRYVAFVSNSVDLVKGVEIDVIPNVYVRDRDADGDGIFDETGVGETSTTLLSIGVDGTAAGIVAGSGAATRPVISGNGLFVAFASEAPDMLVDDLTIVDTNGLGRDVYRASVEGGAVTRINVDGTGVGTGSAGGTTIDLSINRTGSSVAFATSNNGLVTLATNGVADSGGFDIFVGSGNTPVELVSINSDGTDTADDETREPVLSGNGRHVAFFSVATNLVAGATDDNFAEDLFVRDLKSGITSLVSRSGEVPGVVAGDAATPPSSLFDSELTAGPVMSDNGRFLAFRSSAGNLLDPASGITDGDAFSDIFVLDRDPDRDGLFDEADETEMILVTINAAGTGVGVHTDVGIGTAGSSAPSISADGRFVAFASTARDLVPGGTAFPGGHVYVRDLVTGVTSMVSTTASETGIGPSLVGGTRFLAASGDGSRVAFQSDNDASDLDPTVTDPASGSPVPFGEVDIFAATPDPDIVLGRNFASGFDTHTQSFRVRFDETAPFALGYYRSLDDSFDTADVLLGAVDVTDPEDLMVDGNRFAAVTIGTAAGEIAFPGIDSDDPIEDYFILNVADHLDAIGEFDADPFNEDNTRPLRGLYHVPVGPVFVHGSSFASGDTITATVVGDQLEVDYGSTAFGIPGLFTYDLVDVTAVHIRAHGGDDLITGSALTEVAFGGDGADELRGNDGNDMLFGGPGKDLLDGGEGSDTLDGGDGPDTLIGGPGDDTFFDGPGDDLVDVGPGDDVIFATPGSDDIFLDTSGNDLLDFSLHDQGITFDLDSNATQLVDGLNTIELHGLFEDFVGTGLADRLTVRPQPGDVSRRVDGGDGTDQLIIDAGGNTSINDGSKISFPGTDLGDIFFVNFENVFVINSQTLPKIIDNGDDGYSSLGFTTVDDPLFPQGFSGDIEFADPNDATASSATWTFSGLPPGRYQVSATWTAANDRATNAPYSIFADGSLVIQTLVNQEQQPQELFDGGVFFQSLAEVTLTGNTLVVELTDDANDFVIADAVRVAPLDPRTIGLDDHPNHPGGGTVDTVHSGAGSSLSILSAVNNFVSDLGGVDNGDAIGSQGTGRRQITWDEVPDTVVGGSLFPDFYNQIIPRGVVFQTDGQLRVSGSGDPGFPPRFEELNPTYPSAFGTLSDPKLFTPLGSNVTDIRFFVPGTTQPAVVKGFGAVFTDVDTPFESRLEFFDTSGALLRSEFVAPAAGDGMLSFLGVTFDSAAVARVRITSGNGAIPLNFGAAPNDITQGGLGDIVVLDNFIYGEPIAIPDPFTVEGFSSDCLALTGTGVHADHHTCLPGESSTFHPAEIPNGVYAVGPTWSSGLDRSPAVVYTIDSVGEVTVNQQIPPVGEMSGGHVRQPIARVDITNGVTPEIVVSGDPFLFFTTIVDQIQFVPAPKLQLFDLDGNPIENGGTVDIGSVPQNAQGVANALRNFTIKNEGSADLFISDLVVSGPFFSTPLQADVLPAGATTDFGLGVSTSVTGPFSLVATITSNDFVDLTYNFEMRGDVVEDVTPPSVSIVSPNQGADVIEGTTFDIQGEAPDCLTLDETCTVTVGNQTALVRPDGTFLIRNIVVDRDQFTVAVTDPAGNEGTSDLTLNVIPDQSPVVQITSPQDGQGVIEGSSVEIRFDATDDVAVSRVELTINDIVQDTLQFDIDENSEATGILFGDLDTDADQDVSVCAFDTAGNSSCDQITLKSFPTPIVDFGKIFVAPETNGPPRIQVTDEAGALSYNFLPYNRPFLGGVRVAVGDVNGDGTPDIITGAGAGGGPHVKVFDGATGNTIRSFFAYDANFSGGVFVGSADVSGDGIDDIIVGPDVGGGPHIKVFDGPKGALISSFFAFEPSFTGGVRVAVGDVNGDGQADIITGSGPGGGPHVRVFDGHLATQFPPTGTVTTGLLADFFAFEQSFAGGVFVATGDFNADSREDLVFGADQNGSENGGHVKVFNSSFLNAIPPGSSLDGVGILASFFAYSPAFNGGVRVGASDVDDDGTVDVITSNGPGTAGRVKVFDVATGNESGGFDLGPGFEGSAIVSSDEPIFSVVNLSSTPAAFHELDRDGDDIVVRDDNGNELLRTPFDGAKNIRLNPVVENDDLLVVRTVGSGVLPTIVFDGGLDGFDSARLEQGVGIPPIPFLRVDLVGITLNVYGTDPDGRGPGDLFLVDLEPIEDLLDVVDREFVFTDTDDHIEFNTGEDGGDNLLRIDGDNSEVIDFRQASGTTHVMLGDGSDVFLFDLPVDLLPIVDGQGGVDTFILGGSERHLDLTDPSQAKPLNIERIDIVGASPNTLTIDGQSVVAATDSANTLVVVHDDDDTVNYDGDGWEVEAPIFVDNEQHHVINNVDSESRVETINTLPWQNPLLRFDVNFAGGVTSLDALNVINFLGRFNSTPVDLPTPTSAEELPDRYYDVNGSLTATALDALQIINFLGRIVAGGEGETAEFADTTSDIAQISESPLTVIDRKDRSPRDDRGVLWGDVDKVLRTSFGEQSVTRPLHLDLLSPTTSESQDEASELQAVDQAIEELTL